MERLLGTVERMLGNTQWVSTRSFLDVVKDRGATTEEAVCDGPVNTAARAEIIRKLGLRAAAEVEISETDLTCAMWEYTSRMVHRALSPL